MPAPAKVDVTRKARIVVVCGGSGSGKSAWVKQQIRREGRVCAWDPDDEYSGLPGFVRVSSALELVGLLRAHPAPRRLRVAFVALDPKAFDLWGQAVFAWGNCVAVAEETADVTAPSKAPPGWGQLVRRGRKRGVSIYGVTQRPAESDKTIMGNRSLIHVGRMERAADRAYVAREMDIPQTEVDGLSPLEWLEREAGGPLRRGKLRF